MKPIKHVLKMLLVSGGALATALPAFAGSLTVEFLAPDGATGKVLAGLYESAENFPKKGGEKAGQTVAVNSGKATMVFSNVAPGRYAISAFLDRNGNEALDSNVLGIPKEPYGFSRDARGTLGPPGFAEAAFEYDGKDQKIVVQLK